MVTKVSKYNAEGYADPTAHSAFLSIAAADEELERCTNALIKTLKTTIDLAGYDLMARIEIRDRTTGRIFR